MFITCSLISFLYFYRVILFYIVIFGNIVDIEFSLNILGVRCTSSVGKGKPYI